MQQAEKEAGLFGSRINTVADKVTKFGAIALAAAGAATVLVGKEMLTTAVAADRLNKTLEVVASNLKVSNEDLEGMRRALRETNTQGAAATKTMLSFLQSGIAGQVDFKNYTKVIKDFAASVGVTSQTAIEDFTQALVTLQPELLQNYGIQFNLNDLYAKAAEASGVKVAALTTEEKRMAVLNEIYRQGATVQGVYAETYNTAGKNILSIQDRLSEIKEFAGAIFLPAFTQITNAIQTFLKDIVTWLETNKATIEEWGNKIKGGLNIFIDGIKAVTGFLGEHKTAVEIVTGFLTVFFIPALIAVGVQMGINLVTSVANATLNIIKFGLEGYKAIAMLVIKTFQLGLATAAFIVHAVVTGASTVATIAMTVATWLLNAALAVLTLPVFLVIAAIVALIAIGYLLIKNWDSVKAFGKAMLEFITQKFWEFVGKLKEVGGAILDAIMWPFNEAKKRVEEAVNFIKNKLDFTKRQSPSVLDIVTKGVDQVNKAMAGLEFNTSLAPKAAAYSVANAGQSTRLNNISVDLRNSFIGSEFQAKRMGTVVGDAIIKKLDLNVRH